MSLSLCLTELRNAWFPHITTEGLNRIIDLLEKGSPFLLKGTFSGAPTQGCIATHIAWQHPKTRDISDEAGIIWLTRIAGLNPATSQVVQYWDEKGLADWELRMALLKEFADEKARRDQLLESELQAIQNEVVQ
jgi:hypothetical protein